MEQGLGQALTQNGSSQYGLKEIIELLKGGQSPEQLVAMGIPQKLIQTALDSIMKEQQNMSGGLADMYTKGVM